MTITHVAIWAFTLVLAVTAALALAWAVRSGQLREFSAGAESIFDDEEPVGRPTEGEAAPSPHDGGRGGATTADEGRH